MNTNARHALATITTLAIAALAGCSKDGGFFPGMVNHNEGPVDYRVVPIEAQSSDSAEITQSRIIPLAHDALKPYTTDRGKLATVKIKSDDSKQTQPMDTPTIRVTLKQAYVRDFPEFGPVGELAVIVNVKETDAGLTTEEIKSGRVVYYTEGARKNAFLNMRDQTVYGPVIYRDGDLQIRVNILELDNKDNELARSMLKAVASLGAMVYPPASGVLVALEKIGGSLINMNGDDLEWDYAMRLSRSPTGGTDRNVFDAWLKDGYYVMIRSDPSVERVSKHSKPHDREHYRQPPNWSRLALDQRTGEILRLADDGKTVEGIYTDNSYLVFAIQSGFDPTALEVQDHIATLDRLTQALDTRGELFKKSVEEISETVKGLVDQRVANKEAAKQQKK